jgi:two-component system, LytTR family, response regulator
MGCSLVECCRTFVPTNRQYIEWTLPPTYSALNASIIMARTRQQQTATKTFHYGIRPATQESAALPELQLSIPRQQAVTAPVIKNSKKKIMLPTLEGINFEKIKDILYLEASGNYTMLHFADGRQTLVCRSLCEIENKLPQQAFVRIHRSHTIHLHHLKKYVRGKGGHVVLQNGMALAVSTGQKDHFLQVLEDFFG